MTTYDIPKGDGKWYSTTSIVSARAYAIKMIEKHSKATWWEIYSNKKLHSSMIFYGDPAGYKWHYGDKTTNVFKNGKIRRN